MRDILVTGANKGIGFAIARASLAEHGDTFVFLGSRNAERGQEAAASLGAERPEWAARIEVVPIDVADARSVAAARARVAARLGDRKLYGLVNNAGIGSRGARLRDVLEVNTRGVQRVCEAFVPLLDPKGGRIVNVTSASGPMFVARCSPERQRFVVDGAKGWPELSAFLDECIALGDDAGAFAAKGLGDGDAYGLSKACANAYTQILAREHPELLVNACTPGFIETDMTRHYAESQGKSPADMGMKPPSAGTIAPMFLLFGDPGGSGRYYGSDAKRSPLHRYRAPGAPPFTGQ